MKLAKSYGSHRWLVVFPWQGWGSRSPWQRASRRSSMRGGMQKSLLACFASVAGASMLAVISPHAEKPLANLGVLTCTLVKPAQDMAQRMMCGFKPAGSGAEEKYRGIIRESGQALPSGKIVLMWSVRAPADTKASAGMIAQRYVKATSAPGMPATLMGEKNRGIVLEFETNDSAAAYDTIAVIELEFAGTPT
jgi:hypothetical protein